MSKLNLTTPWSDKGQAGGLLSKFSRPSRTSTWCSFSKTAFSSTASSISIHQCWLCRNSFLRYSYKISLLTEFFFLKKKENRAKRHHWLLVHIHVWKSISGFELMPWNNNFSMLLFRLHVWGQLNPKVTCCFHWLRRYQEGTKYSGEGKKFRKHLMEGILVHVCMGGGGEST